MSPEKNKTKIIVGSIVYGQHTFEYLPRFLSSLKNQTAKDFKLIAFNNGEAGDENVKYLKDKYPEIEIMGGGENLGFAKAYNQMIKRAFEERADYFLMVNPDIILEPDVLEKLMQKLEEDKKLGSVSPKILKWNFSAEAARVKAEWPQTSGGSPSPALRDVFKTDIIDSCGIALKSGLHFFDVGQGKKDNLKFSSAKIIGPSGACGLFRMSALERIKEGEKYLDERMFMYKEDCDLNYRLYLSGQKSICAPEAVVYHDRTAAAAGNGDLAAIKARRGKSLAVRRWSLLNQQLIFKKYWPLQNFLSKLNIVWREFKIFMYLIFFERDLLKDSLTIFRKEDKIF